MRGRRLGARLYRVLALPLCVLLVLPASSAFAAPGVRRPVAVPPDELAPAVPASTLPTARALATGPDASPLVAEDPDSVQLTDDGPPVAQVPAEPQPGIRPAPRPVNSRLSCLFSQKFELSPLQSWEKALAEFIEK